MPTDAELETVKAIAILSEQIEGDRRERQVFRDGIEKQLALIAAQMSKNDERITKQELWRMFLCGAVAALTAPYAVKLAALFH